MAASSYQSSSFIGPLIRLWGIQTSQLPSPTELAEELVPFLVSVLQEAVPLIDSAAPKSKGKQDHWLWKHKGDKSSPDSAAKVEVYERIINASDLEAVASRSGITAKANAETWMARRSLHEDAAKTGTASWGEFEQCFRDEHAEVEDAFTPNIIARNEALVWDCGNVEADEWGDTWTHFSLKMQEMRHKIGKPLKDRTFPVLQLAAQVKNKAEFIFVSIPVPDFGMAEASKLAKEKGSHVASYVSVERIRKMPDGKIEWLMATASAAGGILPQFVQNLAMPEVVWKDVPLFLRWISKERCGGKTTNEGKKEAAITAAPETSKGAAVTAAPSTGDGLKITTGPETQLVPEVSEPTNKGAQDTTEAKSAPEPAKGTSATEEGKDEYLVLNKLVNEGQKRDAEGEAKQFTTSETTTRAANQAKDATTSEHKP